MCFSFQKSSVDHRSQVSTKTKLSRHIELFTPFVSANMDTVTKADMAIAMAREGDRHTTSFYDRRRTGGKVNKVKRTVGFVLAAPYTILPDTELYIVWDMAQKYGVDSFAVVDSNQKLIGILSRRDYMFEESKHKKAVDCMTPLKDLIYGKGNTIAEAKIFQKNKIEKFPLVDKEGYLKGLITLNQS